MFSAISSLVAKFSPFLSIYEGKKFLMNRSKANIPAIISNSITTITICILLPPQSKLLK